LSLPKTLADWLRYLETLHPKSIALGLERARTVYDRLSIVPACPVFTVAGTNGKGSTSAFIERMLAAAGYRAGLYTSPHLLRYNERVRIAGREASDDELVDAFQTIEAVRGDVPLTYFEFGTLAALWLFVRARLDALVLEVGLGGRLDAVNIVDADVALVTTIALDHVDYLGATREDIGREKAGIFRPGRTAVCEDPNPPASLVEHARAIGAPLLRLYLVCEHTLCPNSDDGFSNTRTTISNPIVRFLMWNLPYHAEHHLFPNIAFYRLPEAHQYLRPHLKFVAKGYVQVNREIIKSFA